MGIMQFIIYIFTPNSGIDRFWQFMAQFDAYQNFIKYLEYPWMHKKTKYQKYKNNVTR